MTPVPPPSQAMGSPHKRSNKLPKPGFQLRLAGSFLGIAALALLVQMLLLGLRLTELASELSVGGVELKRALPDLLMGVTAFSFGILMPLALALGVLITFRTAGPIYRFERYLQAVALGEPQGECRVRKGDEFQELCDLINLALEAERRKATPASSEMKEAA